MIHSLIDKLKCDHVLLRSEYLEIITNHDAQDLAYLREQAVLVCEESYGKDIYLRGLIEFTNYCQNDCYYCGIRKSNSTVERYILTGEEIIECADTGYALGFRTFVLQGGENDIYSDEELSRIIKTIKTKHTDCAITLSLGERSAESYHLLFEAGADRYLLRHETADKEHYSLLHPGDMSLDTRLDSLQSLKEIGYQVGVGFMVGSPFQTDENLADELLFLKGFDPDMVGIGPFIPSENTPFEGFSAGEIDKVLMMLALIRLTLPNVLLPATTALGTIDDSGREAGILSGANVVMPNLSPVDVRKKYMLYDNKICIGDEAAECRSCLENRMQSIDRHIIVERGDVKKYKPSSNSADDFINHMEIIESIRYADAHRSDMDLIDELLAKAKMREGLTHRETLVLISCDITSKVDEILMLAKQIKLEIYGNRIVMFAPLYLSNYCVNSCAYCPYHLQNEGIARKKLGQDDIRREVIALQDMGHKRLALETGEDDVHSPIEYVLESIETIYNIHHKNGAIRRVNVNIAATSVENYQRLRAAGIGTYILFQETYNKNVYKKLHQHGPKSDYSYHTEAMDRAMEAGIDDVGLGVLFGLDDYRYELCGLLMHKEHLESRFGIGPHTISVPRIRPADDIDTSKFKHAISDEVFARLVAVIRLAVPYTGMIVSTRESAECRRRALELGVSQLSGGSKTSVGGYAEPHADDKYSEQFDISDTRTLEEIVAWLIDEGYIPSFCTACYREGRTGERFMQLAKTGNIASVCQPNALFTLDEYLEDYADEATKKAGKALIAEELKKIDHSRVSTLAKEYIQRIDEGERDFRL